MAGPSANSWPEVVRLGTRGSLLARTQSGHVGAAITAATGAGVTQVLVRTAGDDPGVPLGGPGRPGVFVAALRDRLLAGDVDLVVHSFKDLPSAPVPGLVVAAIPPRVDGRDAVVSRDGRGLADLPAGSRVGTSSPRRVAALARWYPHLEPVAVRGNVDTRIGKVEAGEVDAAILALAGLTRLGRAERVAEILDPDRFVPAPAQGALAVECREDSAVLEMLAPLDDARARATVAAERAVLVGVGATCTTAVGARCRLAETSSGQELTLRAELTAHAGVAYSRVVVQERWDGDPEAPRLLGQRAAARLLAAS